MLGKHGLLIILLAISWAGHAGAADIAPYLDSPVNGHPRANAGLQVSDGALSIRADVAVKSESAVTKTLPQVHSEWALADGIDVVTRVRLPDWNGGIGPSGPAFDTRVQLAPQIAFLDRIEGGIQRAPDGLQRHSLKVGFSDNLAQNDAPGSLAITGNAIIEEILRPGDGNSLGMGVEAIVTGFATPGLGLSFMGLGEPSGSLSLSLRRETGAAADQGSIASFAYDHSWAFQDFAQLGLKLKASQVPDGIEPALGISWQAAF
jgi:hypothetical protein